MANLFNRRKNDRQTGEPTELLELVDMRRNEDSDVETDLDLMIPDMPEDMSEPSEPQIVPDPIQQTSHQAATADTAAPTSPQDARIYTFVGSSGGVGTTTLCTQIAYDLALKCRSQKRLGRRPQDPEVCLIDLNFESGTCAHHLDLMPSLSLEDLTQNSGRIDAAFTSALVSTHSSGVSLLAAPNLPGTMGKINPHAVMAILDAASKLYKYVVIDMPRQLHPWSMAVMGGSDFVGMVSELTIPSLHLTRTQIQHAQNVLGGRTKVEAIISKYERRSFRNSLRLSDAEAALDRNVWATICLDPDTAREAINCGEPVGAVRKDSRYAKDARKLTEKLVSVTTEIAAKTDASVAA